MIHDGVYAGCLCSSSIFGVAGLFWMSFASSCLLLLVVLIDLAWIWKRCKDRQKDLNHLRAKLQLRTEARRERRTDS